MNLSRVSPNGQATIPIDIRRRLGIRGGDKLLFIERENGDVVIENASAAAIVKAQKAFEGAAADFGVETEDDVQRIVNEIRYGEKRA